MKTAKERLIEMRAVSLIRAKYSINDEFKMARKSHDSEEFVEYNAFVEKCIEQAKKDVEKIPSERIDKMSKFRFPNLIPSKKEETKEETKE